MNIALIGSGRMGHMLESLCEKDEGLHVAGFVGRTGYASLADMEQVDAALDFSYPGNLESLLACAVAKKIPLVIGTTGMSGAQGEAIRAASRRIPIVWSENFSVGVTVLVRLARLAAQALGREFDMEIVETHHNRKVDAPSGTAKLILRQIDPEGLYAPVYGRSERICARGREIGVHAVRGGTAAGEHSLRFFGRMEEFELRHRADSREIFAQGALRAAAFAREAEPGLYDMEDVLFGGDGWTRS